MCKEASAKADAKEVKFNVDNCFLLCREPCVDKWESNKCKCNNFKKKWNCMKTCGLADTCSDDPVKACDDLDLEDKTKCTKNVKNTCDPGHKKYNENTCANLCKKKKWKKRCQKTCCGAS